MKRIAVIGLLMAAAASAGMFNFGNPICRLSFDSKKNTFYGVRGCFQGAQTFRLNCQAFLHPREVSRFTFVFEPTGYSFNAYDDRGYTIGYSLTGFARDLENNYISTCQIEYNANPREDNGNNPPPPPPPPRHGPHGGPHDQLSRR